MMDNIDRLNTPHPQPAPSPPYPHFLLLRERDIHASSDSVGALGTLPNT